ncbi:hypothetical protein SCA6_002638 [Theobroma cacao]
MEKSRVLGLMLAALCVITSEYSCNGSESDHEALFDLGNDLNDPENRYGFWNLTGDISPSLLKLRYLEYLDSSLDTFNELDYMELLHQVLVVFLACSFMMSL